MDLLDEADDTPIGQLGFDPLTDLNPRGTRNDLAIFGIHGKRIAASKRLERADRF
jgi:hypothetical protein